MAHCALELHVPTLARIKPGWAPATNGKAENGLLFSSSEKPIDAIHRLNFLYFSRCGMIESVPSRRILSAS
jgi:hypothetical protein